MSQNHTDLKGKPLEKGLVNFTERAKRNFKQHISLKGNNKHDFVYITDQEKQEAQKVENLTKEQLKEKIFEGTRTLESYLGKLYYELFQKDVKNQKKITYISFYEKIMALTKEGYSEQEIKE